MVSDVVYSMQRKISIHFAIILGPMQLLVMESSKQFLNNNKEWSESSFNPSETGKSWQNYAIDVL